MVFHSSGCTFVIALNGERVEDVACCDRMIGASHSGSEKKEMQTIHALLDGIFHFAGYFTVSLFHLPNF